MEFAYIIERHINSQLLYFNGRYTDERSFTPKHDDALRFSREEDAAIILSWLLGGVGRVTKHGWETKFVNKNGKEE